MTISGARCPASSWSTASPAISTNAKSTEHSFNAKETNLSHAIHHVSFGDPPELMARHTRNIPRDFQLNMAPLDHRVFTTADRHMTLEHHMKVVTTWFKLGWKPVLGYQLQHTNYQYSIDEQHADDDDGNLPEARFSYDLSPAAVTIMYGGRRWYEFLTNLCAIIGGVFTVMGLLDRSLHGIRSKVFKENSGKLG